MLSADCPTARRGTRLSMPTDGERPRSSGDGRVAKALGRWLDPADRRRPEMRRQQQGSTPSELLDEGDARLAREIGVRVRLRRHRGDAQLNLMVDDVAGNGAVHALIVDVDDDVAGRVTEAGLQRDAVVESVVVVYQHDLLDLLHRQHAILEAEAMDARVA